MSGHRCHIRQTMRTATHGYDDRPATVLPFAGLRGRGSRPRAEGMATGGHEEGAPGQRLAAHRTVGTRAFREDPWEWMDGGNCWWLNPPQENNRPFVTSSHTIPAPGRPLSGLAPPAPPPLRGTFGPRERPDRGQPQTYGAGRESTVAAGDNGSRRPRYRSPCLGHKRGSRERRAAGGCDTRPVMGDGGGVPTRGPS